MHTFFLELDFSFVSVFTNTGKFGTVLGLNNKKIKSFDLNISETSRNLLT